MNERRRRIINVKKGVCPTDEPTKTRYIPRLTNVHAIVLFTIILSTTSIIGALYGFPTMMFISYFALATVITSVFKEHVVLNSIIAPFAFLSMANTVVDVVFNTGAWIVHLPVAILAIAIVNTRRAFDLSIMIASSVLYSIWLYTIFVQFYGGFVDPSFSAIPMAFRDPLFTASMVAVGCLSTSFGIWFLRSRCRSSLFPWMKKVIY